MNIHNNHLCSEYCTVFAIQQKPEKNSGNYLVLSVARMSASRCDVRKWILKVQRCSSFCVVFSKIGIDNKYNIPCVLRIFAHVLSLYLANGHTYEWKNLSLHFEEIHLALCIKTSRTHSNRVRFLTQLFQNRFNKILYYDAIHFVNTLFVPRRTHTKHQIQHCIRTRCVYNLHRLKSMLTSPCVVHNVFVWWNTHRHTRTDELMMKYKMWTVGRYSNLNVMISPITNVIYFA